jgi:putative colanic acid biosynthesis acetyltransferase WcaF
MSQIHLSEFDNSWYSSKRSRLVEILWYFTGAPLIRSSLLPFSAIRSHLLQLFGAGVGIGVVLKPGIRVKYPWMLTIGKHAWIGEDVWIDNLAPVTIGDNVCISQDAYLCTGSHDWSDPAFGLKLGPIDVEDGAWIGARAMICPGVRIEECAVASAGSIVTRNIPAFEIHAGNPAKFVRTRKIFSKELLLELTDIGYPSTPSDLPEPFDYSPPSPSQFQRK